MGCGCLGRRPERSPARPTTCIAGCRTGPSRSIPSICSRSARPTISTPRSRAGRPTGTSFARSPRRDPRIARARPRTRWSSTRRIGSPRRRRPGSSPCKRGARCVSFGTPASRRISTATASTARPATKLARIGGETVPQPSFLDPGVSPGPRVRYRVTAVDRATPPNESEPSTEVELRVVAEPGTTPENR